MTADKTMIDNIERYQKEIYILV